MSTYPREEPCKHNKFRDCDPCDAEFSWTYDMYLEDQDRDKGEI